MNIRQAMKIDLDTVKNITNETIHSEQGVLDFYYQHVNKQGQLRIGKCHSIPHVLENYKLELHEEWQWLNGDKSTGSSIIIEI